MSEQIFNESLKDEISLKDISDFFMESWKPILGVGFLGLLGSVGFLVVTPNQYEAIAQIKMAQTSPNRSTDNLMVNVEPPSLLLERLKLPTNYSAAEIKACGLEKAKMPAESLVALAKFSPVKGVGTIVVLKIRGKYRENAVICAQALYENIRESQNQIVKPYIEEAKTLITKYHGRLKEAQELVTRADKSGAALSATYLANRDEVNFLTGEIIRLTIFLTSSGANQTKLVSPIYASETPVFPNKRITVIVGLLAGLFLGLLLVGIRKGWLNYQASQK